MLIFLPSSCAQQRQTMLTTATMPRTRRLGPWTKTDSRIERAIHDGERARHDIYTGSPKIAQKSQRIGVEAEAEMA